MTTQAIDPLVNSSGETVAKNLNQTMQRADAGSANRTATASQQNRVRYVPAETGATYWGPGDQVTILITGAETGGAFSLVAGSCPPGGGPPPHIHSREDESFYVFEGTLTIQVGGDTITASPGDLAFLPRGIVHSFKNNGDVTAKALVLITPAGLENFFAETFDPAVDRSAPPPPPSKELIARLLAAAPRYGLAFPPPA
jgi:quercetin dioxygenase-like cupin family protein